MNKLTLLLGGVLIIAIGAAAFIFLTPQASAPQIPEPTSFEECVAQGNPVMESYPRQCRTESGKHFSEDIGNANEKQDLIVTSTPRPGDTVASPLVVSGQARGNWYFEASFPIAVEDAQGNIIGEGYAEAQGEWMTTDFVPFTSIEISFPPQEPGSSGMLVLYKHNASGLPEHDDYLEFPIKF